MLKIFRKATVLS